MRTLVLGGTGMLGRAVRAEGRRRGHAVLALSHTQGDIADPQQLRHWMEAFRPQLVVNCAAFTKVDDCETAQQTAMAINGEAVAHVVAAAAAGDADLIHVSSDYVFDGKASTPYGEEAPTAPLSVYGASKLRGEREALAYPRALVLRASWLFGPGGPSFPQTICRLIHQGRLPLRVVDDQVGCPTYTPYLARAIWDLAGRPAVRGVLHYRNREPVSWHGFATAIAAIVRPGTEVIPVPTSAFPRPAPRPAYSVLDVGRFEAAVGRPVEPWASGLAAYLDTLGGEP